MFFNYFFYKSLTAASLLGSIGRSVQDGIPVQNELRTTALQQSLLILSCFLTTIVFYSPCISVACCIHTGTFGIPSMLCVCVWMRPGRTPKYMCYELTFKHKTCSVFQWKLKRCWFCSLPVYIQHDTHAVEKQWICRKKENCDNITNQRNSTTDHFNSHDNNDRTLQSNRSTIMKKTWHPPHADWSK